MHKHRLARSHGLSATPDRCRCIGALAVCTALALAACGGGGGEPTQPANVAPTVAIDAPLAHATVTAGATVRIAATASDSDGNVVRVEFYDGTAKLGEDTSAPFEFVWTGTPAGTHTVTARAVDNAGAVALSGSVVLTVAAPAAPEPSPAPTPSPTPSPAPTPAPAPNQAPTVSLVAPTAGFKPTAPATFTLAANAADSDGHVVKVEFFRIDPIAPVYDASTLVGSATATGSPPAYRLQTTQDAGNHTFVARATDNLGASGTSASAQVIVNALPSVAITSPQARATVVPGTTLTLRATASDADGSIGRLEFLLDGSTVIGAGTRVGTTDEYTMTWTTTVQGTYGFTARATDNDGAQQSTASVAVNVPANALPAVSLDEPVAGTNVPTTLTLAASASDSDGTIAAVEFFNGSASLGLGTFDPTTGRYRRSVPVSHAQPGTYTITARATDNLGGQRTTASRSVTIAANLPPAVSITSPATYTLPAAVVLTASASDSDGVAKVEFFSGATRIGESTTAPFKITWTAAAVGTYSITARATDAVGSMATSAAQTLVVGTAALTMNCADGATTQCSGDTVIRVENGVALTRSGVQAHGRSTSDLLPTNPTPPTAKGFALASGGVAEVRLRRDATGTPSSVAMLLDHFGLSWNGRTARPRLIETFDPTAGRVQLDGHGALLFSALPASTDLGFYDHARLGTAATEDHYANNRYFPRALPARCDPGDWCATAETTGPRYNAGDWRTGGNDPDHLSATRYHEDGDVHAGNGLPDAVGNPTWLPGGNGFGVPVPGSKGSREIRHWSYRYANLASWFSQDTVNIVEWGGLDEHAKNRRGFVAYGDVTAPDTLPATGTVTYLGVMHGQYAATSNGEPMPVVGLATLTVDFAARTVTVVIDRVVRDDGIGTPVAMTFNSTATLRPSGETNHFNGVAAGSALDGGLGGRLFGPVGAGGSGIGPAEIGAVFVLSNPSTSAALIGGLVARRQ